MKEINLIPQEYARARHNRQRMAVWGKLVVAVLATIGALGYNLHLKVKAVEVECKDLEARARFQAQVAQTLTTMAAERSAITRKLGEIYDIQQMRYRTALLYDVSAACNEQVFLTELSLDKEKNIKRNFLQNNQEDEPAGEGEEIVQIKGYSLTNLDLTRFVSNLSRSANLQDVNLKFWRQDTIDGLKLISFEVECRQCCPSANHNGV